MQSKVPSTRTRGCQQLLLVARMAKPHRAAAASFSLSIYTQAARQAALRLQHACTNQPFHSRTCPIKHRSLRKSMYTKDDNIVSFCRRPSSTCVKQFLTGWLASYESRRCLHFSCAMCPLRAVVRVNSAPHFGQVGLEATPDFSRWWRSRLLNVENFRPLQPWSQHCGFGCECTTRTVSEDSWGAFAGSLS